MEMYDSVVGHEDLLYANLPHCRTLHLPALTVAMPPVYLVSLLVYAAGLIFWRRRSI